MKYLKVFNFLCRRNSLDPDQAKQNFRPELWTGAKLFYTLEVRWYDALLK